VGGLPGTLGLLPCASTVCPPTFAQAADKSATLCKNVRTPGNRSSQKPKGTRQAPAAGSGVRLSVPCGNALVEKQKAKIFALYQSFWA